MNTAFEYSTRVVQEGGRRCKKSTLNDLVHLTPLRIPLMNPPSVSAHLAEAYTATLMVMVNVMGGGCLHPPPLPAWANFTLMMERTPESSVCYSVYSVVYAISNTLSSAWSTCIAHAHSVPSRHALNYSTLDQISMKTRGQGGQTLWYSRYNIITMYLTKSLSDILQFYV